MANQIRLKRASGSDPGASDLVTGEVAIRTDTGKIFTKKDDNSVVELGVGISDVVEDTSPQLGGDLQSNGNDVDFADNDKAIFGTGGDLDIYHSSSNAASYIQNSTGNLFIEAPAGSAVQLRKDGTTEVLLKAIPDGAVELYHDNSKKFETTANGADINSGSDISMDSSGNGQLRVLGNGYSGGIALNSSGLHLYHNSSSRAIIFGINESEVARFDTTGNFDIANDSGKIRLGASNDLQIYHDGSHSRIQDAGTGKLILQGSEINLNNSDSSEYGLRVIEDGAVELYHNGSKKFETTSSGISVTGGATFSGDVSFGDNNITNVGVIALDTIKGDADDNTNIMFGGSDTVTVNPAGTTRLAINTSGISVTGNITVSGTVDGRDVAADGTKLDGIESGATADQSASEILTLIKTVDGAGSGLDADTLDGISSASFVRGDATDNGATEITVNDADFIVEDTTDSTTNFIWRDHSGGKLYLGTSTAVVTARSNVNPQSDSTFNLGANGTRWANIYGDQLYGGGSNITGLNASNLGSGTVPQARMSSSSIVALIADQTIAPSTIDMEDNEKIKLGTGDDLEIYHNGSNSVIHDNGTGDLKIIGDDVHIQATNDEAMAKFIENGAVELYHNGSKKLETYSGGLNVTGYVNLTDSQHLQLGTGNDLQLFHNGSNSQINNITGHLLIGGERIKLTNPAASHVYLDATLAGSVDLYHNNSKKLATISGGVEITGDVVPEANNSRDLGSSSLRWANLFVNDMHFANSPDNPNKVDGTWGDWTLQEGEDTIYMLNNRNGKQYKMNLTEV